MGGLRRFGGGFSAGGIWAIFFEGCANEFELAVGRVSGKREIRAIDPTSIKVGITDFLVNLVLIHCTICC